MATIQIKDKRFRKSISNEEIMEQIQRIAKRMNKDYAGKDPIFLGVLNGSFMFIADLFKYIDIQCEVSFVKVASYHGTSTTGAVKELVGLKEDISGRDVIIVEDIVDTGITIDHLWKDLQSRNPKSLTVATLLYKPDAYTKNVPLEYIALEIPNEFIVGYGLDYDGLGRNLNDIYTLDIETASTNEETMMNLVLFGPPGAGKGTQSEKLIKKYALAHISTGDIFRANIKGGTELGLKAKEYMDQGHLVPDEVTIGMLEAAFLDNKDSKGIIFDGFPRTIPQAEALDAMMAKHNCAISGMVALEVEEEELTKRLLNRGKTSGRSDDQDESLIRNRVQEYENKTAPVADYYKAQNKFASVSGVGELDSIFDSLCTAVEQF